MADELISRQAAIEAFAWADADVCEMYDDYDGCDWGFGRENIKDVLSKLSPVDAVSRGLFEQIKWERDIAMEQLEEHGIAFGAKAECAVDAVEVVRCGECIHRHEGLRPNCHGRRPDWFCADGIKRPGAERRGRK